MPSIDESYQVHEGNYTHGGNSCAYIVVHNTGNTASADAEARYAQNNQHNSSYHYVLDDDNIFHVLDDYDTAWAVGAWSGARQLIGNNESISIEVCSNGTYFTEREIENLAYLVGVLMERHNVPAENVVRHYDCHTGHKDCPAAYTDDGAWNELWSIITQGGDIVTDDDISKIAARVWEYSWGGQDNCYNTLHGIRSNVEPRLSWEYIYGEGTDHEDKILGEGQHSNRYNVLNAIFSKLVSIEERLDSLEK